MITKTESLKISGGFIKFRQDYEGDLNSRGGGLNSSGLESEGLNFEQIR